METVSTNAAVLSAVKMELIIPEVVQTRVEWKIRNFVNACDLITNSDGLQSDWFVPDNALNDSCFQILLRASAKKKRRFELGLSFQPADDFGGRKQTVAFDACILGKQDKEISVAKRLNKPQTLSANEASWGKPFSKKLASNSIQQDDSLTIVVDLKFIAGQLAALKSKTIVEEPKAPTLPKQPPPSSPPATDEQCEQCVSVRNLYAQVQPKAPGASCGKNLLFAEKFSDLAIAAKAEQNKLERTTVDIDRQILVQASPVFAQMFNDAEPGEDDLVPLEIRGFNSYVVSEMLLFINGNELKVERYSAAFTADLLLLAAKYEIAALVEICASRLNEAITTENVASIYAKAALSNSEPLKEAVFKWLSEFSGECATADNVMELLERCEQYDCCPKGELTEVVPLAMPEKAATSTTKGSRFRLRMNLRDYRKPWSAYHFVANNGLKTG